MTPWISSLSSSPLDLSLMDMTEPPEYIFDDDVESSKTDASASASAVSSTQAKLRAALAAADDDDDCGNCSL